MGFAVVADEVRNLAQRCAQAAKETAGKSTNGRAAVSDAAAGNSDLPRAGTGIANLQPVIG